MTVDSLKDCNKKFLAQMAKEQGIVGWHAMRKDQLIRALSIPQVISKKSAGKAATAEKASEVRTSRPRRRGRGAPESADPGVPAAVARSRVRQGPDRRGRPRPVLAPFVLGAEPLDPGAGAGRARPGMAHGPADPAPDGRHQRGHHQRVRAARPRHRDPWRREQLVHRRPVAPPVVPDRHRLPRPPRQVLRPGPVERRHHAQGGHLRHLRRELVERPGAVPAALPPVGGGQRLVRRARPARPVRGAVPSPDAQPVAPEPGDRRPESPWGAISTSRSTRN